MFSNYFELRQLRKDVQALDRDNDYQKRERETADRKVREAERRIDKLTGEKAALEKAKENLSKKVREQTGADLLVNALRELGVLPKPEKYDAFAEQARLQQQFRGTQQAQYGQAQDSGLGSLLGGGIR